MQLVQVGPRDRKALGRFIRLPFEVMADEKNWVPPFSKELRLILSRRHPFFNHSDAAFFLVSRGGEDLGRLGVFEHRPYNDHHGERTAFFTFFDARNDSPAVQLLFDAASQWASDRGLTRLTGPKGFVRSDGQGLLVEGYHYFPALGIPWNPPCYKELVEGAGFLKKTDLLSASLDLAVPGDDRLYRVAEIARRRGAFNILAFRKPADLWPWIPALKELQHCAFADNPNYIPSTDAEVQQMARNMMVLADLSIMRFLTRGGDLAGFMFAFPNVGRALRRSRGRLLPFGWAFLLWERKRSKLLDLNGIGIHPRYQKQGGDAILFTELEKCIRASRYTSAEVIQIDEKNILSLSGMEHFGVHWHKRHRIYTRETGEA